jgi:hypothetical protein
MHDHLAHDLLISVLQTALSEAVFHQQAEGDYSSLRSR